MIRDLRLGLMYSWISSCFYNNDSSKTEYIFDEEMVNRHDTLNSIQNAFNIPLNFTMDSYFDEKYLLGFIDDVTNEENLDKYGLEDKGITIFPDQCIECYINIANNLSEYIRDIHNLIEDHQIHKRGYVDQEEKIAWKDDLRLFVSAKHESVGYSLPTEDDLVEYQDMEDKAKEV